MVDSQDKVLSIPYGAEMLNLAGLADWNPDYLLPHSPLPPRDAEEVIRESLEHPIGSPPLREIARGRRSAVILIPGKDRVAASSSYVPLLIEELRAGGLREEQIRVFLATGTHEHHGQRDLELLLGEETFRRVKCVNHDCRDFNSLTQLGTTARGTPVWFSREVLAAELKILTGRITPHYFAGFSGGRKAMLPGAAGFPTILHNHRLTLSTSTGVAKGVANCRLADNPVHMDMLEAAALARPDFCLNTLLEAGTHRVVETFAGDTVAAHEAGCRRALPLHQVLLREPVDALITAAGGDPYDCNFIQGLKALFDVQDAVRPGGSVLWIAECAGGMPSAFGHWAAFEDDDALDAAVRREYNLAGHNSIMLRRLVRRMNIALVSKLPTEQVAALGVTPMTSLENGLAWLRERMTNGSRLAIVPYANVTHVTAEGSDFPVNL